MRAKSIITVMQDNDIVKFLTEVGHLYNDYTIKLMQIKEEKQTEVFIKTYPSSLPLNYTRSIIPAYYGHRTQRHQESSDCNVVGGTCCSSTVAEDLPAK